MNLGRIGIILNLIVFLGLTACAIATPPIITSQPTPQAAVNPPAPAQPTATWTPAPTWTPTPSPQPTPTNTRVPTITPTSTATPTPEPLLTAKDTLKSPINVRSGPGTAYPVVGEMKPGEITLVTGRNSENSWWQVSLTNTQTYTQGWVYGELAAFSGSREIVPVVAAPPPPPSPTPAAAPQKANDQPLTPEELADKLRCGKDFCVTYQALVPIWENGGCIGNHSIYITVLQGLPPGQPLDGVVVGDTYNNVTVASGDHGPGRTEITLWSNSMTLIVKRNIDGTPYTSQESFNFTARDELIPAEVLASAGYCEGNVEKCEFARNHNQVCRGHYSWRVTFHKFD